MLELGGLIPCPIGRWKPNYFRCMYCESTYQIGDFMIETMQEAKKDKDIADMFKRYKA
jgi:hypothetical protein